MSDSKAALSLRESDQLARAEELLAAFTKKGKEQHVMVRPLKCIPGAILEHANSVNLIEKDILMKDHEHRLREAEEYLQELEKLPQEDKQSPLHEYFQEEANKNFLAMCQMTSGKSESPSKMCLHLSGLTGKFCTKETVYKSNYCNRHYKATQAPLDECRSLNCSAKNDGISWWCYDCYTSMNLSKGFLEARQNRHTGRCCSYTVRPLGVICGKQATASTWRCYDHKDIKGDSAYVPKLGSTNVSLDLRPPAKEVPARPVSPSHKEYLPNLVCVNGPAGPVFIRDTGLSAWEAAEQRCFYAAMDRMATSTK